MPAELTSGVTLASLLPPWAECGSAEGLLITGLTLDSRKAVQGNLFLAVQGWKQDGRSYIANAVAAGCVAVVAEAKGFDDICPRGGTVIKGLEKAGIPLIMVSDLQAQISLIAANYYGHPGQTMEVIGVTGTNGKTTCVSLLAQMSRLLGDTAGLVGTLGWGVVDEGEVQLAETGMTTPDVIQLQRIQAQLAQSGVQVLAMEVSSHGLEQGRVEAAGIDCGIFTNLSRDHLDFHGSEESYAAAKAKLFALPGLKQAVVNIDDSFGAGIYATLPKQLMAISYGLAASADVRARDVAASSEGVTFHLDSPWGEGLVRSKLLGEFNVLNLLAVIAAFGLRGADFTTLLSLVPLLEPVAGRMEVVDRKQKPLVVVDYSHTPDALKKALLSLRRHCKGELWCLFGCGGDRDQGKRPLMGGIAEQLADRVVVTSDNPRGEKAEAIIDQILVGMAQLKNVRVVVDRRAAIETAIAEAGADDCVLVAGKGHENYQQIGETTLPFSDVGVAATALKCRAHSLPGVDQ